MRKKDKLIEIIEKGKNLIGNNLTSSSPEFNGWNSKLIRFLGKSLGDESQDYKRIFNRNYSLYFISGNETKQEYTQAMEDGLNVTLRELEELLDDIDDCLPIDKIQEVEKNKDKSINISINNQNSNQNVNFIQYNSIADIKKVIIDNSMLDDNSKDELLKKLDEIEDLQKSNKNKNEKWKIAKEILAFIVDKGVDIAIMFIPQILLCLK